MSGSAGAKPSAVPSASVVRPAATYKPSPKPVTPSVPPELVACGSERDFYRLAWSTLDVYQIAKELPPPQIRGSRIAQKTNEVTLGEPLNVFMAAKKSVVAIAKDGVFHYEAGQRNARRHAPISTAVPIFAWPDPRRPDSFYVRNSGDAKLHEYSLSSLPSVDADANPPSVQAARQTEALPGFDARLFALLADNTPSYSTSKGLVRRGKESQPTPLPESSGPPTLLFADAAPQRYWTADASSRLALWDPERGASPVFTASVPGVVIDAAAQGDRVAVLSITHEGQTYLPIVTIFSNGKELARIDTGPTFLRQPPALDLCLIPGLPWVLVGGQRWLQLLDWESRRLLAEW